MVDADGNTSFAKHRWCHDTEFIFCKAILKVNFLVGVCQNQNSLQIQLGSIFCRYLACLPVVDADGNTSFAFGICTAKSAFLIVNVFRFSVEYILFIIKVSRLSSLY